MDDPTGLAERYQFARDLTLRAGGLAKEYAGRLSELEIRTKGAQDVVTEADIEVERLIKKDLAEWDGDGFLGEETGSHGLTDPAGGVWVVDPIDGTQPFASGLPSWAVSIGYVRDGAPQFGFVYGPVLEELYEGGRGRPALLNGRPIKPHHGRSLQDGIVSVGYSPRLNADTILPVISRLLRQGGMYYRDGCASLSLCYVACGRLLGYVEPHLNSWDAVGGLAVAWAAGAQTNDFLHGDALTRGNRLVASAPAVYHTLDEVLA